MLRQKKWFCFDEKFYGPTGRISLAHSLWVHLLRYVVLLIVLSGLSSQFSYSQTGLWKKISFPEELNFITALAKDGGDNLWIGSSRWNTIEDKQEAVIAIFNHDLEFDKYLDKNNSPLSTYPITDIKLNKIDLSIWIATGNGLIIYNGVNWTHLTKYNSKLPSNKISAINFDKAGNKYLATEKGLVRISPDNEWTIFNASNTKMNSEDIRALATDSKNNLWFTTFTSVYAPVGNTISGLLIKFDGVDFTYFYMPGQQNYGISIAISQDDSIWIGMPQTFYSKAMIGGGITKFDGKYTQYNYPALLSNMVVQVCFSKKNKLFIASNFHRKGEVGNGSPGGLSYYQEGEIFSFDSLNSPLSHSKFYNLTTIFIDLEDKVYMGGDADGIDEVFMFDPSGISEIGEDIPIVGYSLAQNYPNPFNPITKINYSIPQNSFVKIEVYNVLGKEVSILVDGFKTAGTYEVEFNGNNLPSGVYLYRIINNGYVVAKKMILLR